MSASMPKIRVGIIGFYKMVDLMYQSLCGEQDSVDLPTFDDGHKVQSVLDAIIASSNTHSRVQVDYNHSV